MMGLILYGHHHFIKEAHVDVFWWRFTMKMGFAYPAHRAQEMPRSMAGFLLGFSTLPFTLGCVWGSPPLLKRRREDK